MQGTKPIGQFGHLGLVAVKRHDSKLISLANFPHGRPRAGQNVVGHLVRERDGEILCALPGIRPEERVQSFLAEDLEIIHPDAGCIMRRNKQDRPRVPIHILRLLNMCTTSQRAAQLPSTPDACCFVCERLDMGDVMQCPMCLLSFHESCVEKLLPDFVEEDTVDVHLPRCFEPGKCCQLCAHKLADR